MLHLRLPRIWSARRCVALCALALIGAALPGPALAIGGMGSISGTVFDAHGTPAADAYVSACNSSCESAMTATTGTYTITGLAAGSYRIGIEDFSGVIAGGYATATGVTTSSSAASLVTVADAAVTFDVHATPGTLVSGTITAQAGGSLSAVFVGACLVMAAPVDPSFLPCGIAPAAPDGTYSLSVLPGAYRVFSEDLAHALASGYYSVTGYVFGSRLATILTIGPVDVSGISMALPAGASIAGTVTDSLGTPVLGMSAEACLTSDLLACAFDVTGTDGSYTITGLPIGTYDVIFQDAAAEHPGGYYSTAGFAGDSAQATAVAVGSSGATGVDARLPVGRLVSGVITGATGSPVSVEISDCTATICIPLTRSSSDGSYTINLAPGKHRIHISDDTGASLSGYYSTGGVANQAHATVLTVATTDLTGINVKLRRIVGSIHPGTTHSGKFVTSTVVRTGTYATMRFNLGKTLAGTKIAVLRAVKNSAGTWSTYRKVATIVVAADGYAYYSAKVSGSLGFKASASDVLLTAVLVMSAPVFVRSK